MIPNYLPDVANNELLLSRLYLLQDLLNVIQQNINLELTAAPGFIASQNNGNLFQLASKYYQDATLWTEIANINQAQVTDINGFINPNITSLVDLIIPPKPATPSGGIYVV